MYLNIKNISPWTLNVTLNQLTTSSLWHIRVSVSASSDSTGAAKQVLVLVSQYYNCTCNVGSACVEKLNVKPFCHCICCSVSVLYIGLQLKCIWCQEFPVHSFCEITTLCELCCRERGNVTALLVESTSMELVVFRSGHALTVFCFFLPPPLTPFLV